jgi:hypothetical protein
MTSTTCEVTFAAVLVCSVVDCEQRLLLTLRFAMSFSPFAPLALDRDAI